MAAEHTIITIQNIDDEDFMFQYNASEGNPPYLIAAGEVARFPKFLAEHALKHLTDKILNKRGERTNNQLLRDELANQIIIGEEKSPQVAPPSEQERLKVEIEELNRPSTLDAILSKRKEEKVHKEKIKKEVKASDPSIGEKFEGLDEVKPEVKPEPKEEPPKAPVKAKPTRKELYTHAEKEMNMVMDKKTTKKLAKMNVDQLIDELQFPDD